MLNHATVCDRWLATRSLIILVIIVACSFHTSRAAQALLGCLDRCGNLTVPYPFGVGDGCYFSENDTDKFSITCNYTAAESPIAYLGTGNIDVTKISLDGEMQTLLYIGFDCYDKKGLQKRGDKRSSTLELDFFSISTTKNKFTAIGCDTYAILEGLNEEGERYTTGCMSICDSINSINYGSCNGAGCCETSIPSGLKTRNVTLDSYYKHKYIWSFNPCSYAFTVEATRFNFSETSLEDLKNTEKLPVILDWSIGNTPCDEAKRLGPLACKGNSDCVNSTTRPGYLCRCWPGFEGNPYHPDGCQDIDECKYSNPCINGTCNNILGSFTCTCLDEHTKFNDTSCSKVNYTNERPRRNLFIYIIPSSISVGLVAVFAVTLMFCWGMRKRKLIKLKEKFFQQNGGLMLERRLSSQHGSSLETTRIFSAEELENATNKYDQSRIVGEGGYGTVYKGILADDRVVAIKKPKSVSAQNVDPAQFINEVVVLMQINHRNVVRLLGCCLETEAPLLVYEFITNGTLFQHIHQKDPESESSLSWGLRLKIAAETAGALAYLHAETVVPIIHRDVKTMNILVDENYTAKVSDFGTSRLIPLDQEELSTFVQGTLGYLDPEYMQSTILTEKSDVYSFGVVLAELLTGKKALTFDRAEGVNNLAMSFVSLMEDDQLLQLVDDSIVDDGNLEEIKEVASLTKRCLSLKGEDRPTMKFVAMELEGLRITGKHPWGKDKNLQQSEETEYLLGPPSIPYALDIESGSSSITTAGYDSVQTQLILMPHNNLGR
ncbi:hypothetical protein UlMin_037607 [Ulmus minor]